MGITYAWEDENRKTVLRYTAEGDWNWNDYHKAVRMSLFMLHNLGHDVDVIIDLSGTGKIPAGAVAHVRSFGKRLNLHMTGNAVVIGMDATVEKSLLAGRDERVLRVGEQAIYFVDDNESAQAIIDTLHK